MGVALVRDERELADAAVALAQFDVEVFGHPVVSTMTRARSRGFIASVLTATAKLSCSSACSRSSPMRWRQRESEERSSGNSCWKNSSPQKYWKYGFSTQRSHTPSSLRS